MDDDWLFSNENEVDQEELEVALYSQIHFDTVIENEATSAPLKCAPDLDFVQPSFQVKVRNYMRKKTANSSVKKAVTKPQPVYNLDFISLSSLVEDNDISTRDNNDCENKDTTQKEMPPPVSGFQPAVTTISHKDSHSHGSHDKEGDNHDKISEKEKSESISGHSPMDSEEKATLSEKPVSDISPVVICDSSSDAGKSDNDDITSSSVVNKPELASEPPPIIVSDSDTDTSDNGDEEKTLQAPVVLKYHRDSDVSDSDDAIAAKEHHSTDEQDSESEGVNNGSDDNPKTRLQQKDMSEELGQDSIITKKTMETNSNSEIESEEELVEEEIEEDHLSIASGEVYGAELQRNDDVISKKGMSAALKTPKCDESNQKWALDEEDRVVSKTPVNRYYNPKTIRCRNCNEEGHLALFCTKEKKSVCIFCGNEGHSHFDCPKAICFKCCTPGHKPSICMDAKRLRYVECYRCWLKGHIGKACPDLWRQFHLTIGLDSNKIVQGDGEQNPRIYCYNCGQKGHLGFECDSQRMSLYVYPSYPFVAEYDKWRIHKDDSSRRGEKSKKRKYDHLNEEYRETQEDYYHRREEYKERQEDSSRRRGKHRENQDKKTRGKDNYKEIQDDSSHRRARHKEIKDDGSHRKAKHKETQDDGSHKKVKLTEISDDYSSLSTGKHKRKKEMTSHDKVECKGKQDKGPHKKEKPVKVGDDSSNKREKNSKKQLKRKVGNERKEEDSEALERKVSKSKNNCTAMNGIEDLRIQVNQQSFSPAVSLGKSSRTLKENEKNREKERKENRGKERKENREKERKENREKERKENRDRERKKNSYKVRYVPETNVSGSSHFMFQEPTHSKYAVNGIAFNSSEVEYPSRYSNYDGFSSNENKIRFDSKQTRRKGRGKQAFHEMEFMREEDAIEDYSNDMFLEETFKPSAPKRRKYNKKRHSPISFIGLMD